MLYNLQIQKILLEIEGIQKYEDKIKKLKEAIHIADNHQDLDRGWDLRLRLLQYETTTSRCEESFQAFSWLMETYANNPDDFDESDYLWEYKWMVGASLRNSSISLAQIDVICADLKARLIANGYSLRAYYNVMTNYYNHLREYDKAFEYIQLANAEVRDDMTNCEACEQDTLVENLVNRGDIEKALLHAKDLINKRLTCFSMPFQTFCMFAYYLQQAKDERAVVFFDKALEEYYAHDEYDSSLGYSLGLLILYMKEVEHAKVYEFFEKVSAWEIGAEDLNKYYFGKLFAMLFAEKGEVELNLSPSLPYYQSSGRYDKAVLRAYFQELAFDYARRFDYRNKKGNLVKELEELFLNV